MSYNKGYRYVAYDAANGEYQEFKTIDEAKKWLTCDDYEEISCEAIEGRNYIAEIQYKSRVDVIDRKCDYECAEDWDYRDDIDWIGKQEFEKINWEE